MPGPRLTPEQQALALTCLGLAWERAIYWQDRAGKHGDIADVTGAAMEGLCDAAARFDPGRGQPFPCYASMRIDGTIMDALRRLNNPQCRSLSPEDMPRVVRLDMPPGESTTGTLAETLTDACDPFEAVDSHDGFEAVIAHVNGVHREILKLLYLDPSCGSFRRVGKRLNRSESWAWTRYQEAIRAIRSKINTRGETEDERVPGEG